jgi:dihydropteroate synthase
MGVLNVTPDSFSDGGRWNTVDRALRAAEAMLEAGADLVDVGGESTRPGADPVSPAEELGRVLPVIEAIRDRFACPLSVDSSAPEVMSRAVSAGACLINDVRGLTRPGALAAAADSGACVCVMHMRGEPATMDGCSDYRDVVAEVIAHLESRIVAARAAGIPEQRMLADPGFGFAKTTAQNFEMLGRLREFESLGVPLLVGMSRKRMIGESTGRPVERRATGSVAAALLAAERGARILRVHDVEATRDALCVWQSMQESLGR